MAGARSRGVADTRSAREPATAIATGILHNCALTQSGGVKCWGSNYYGQLGDGTGGSRNDRWTPIDVSGLGGGVTAIGGGLRQACALSTLGGLKCWGDNRYGQVGDGTATGRWRPVDVFGLSQGVAAVTGGFHTCALTNSGGVKCWGMNAHGELGDGTTTDRWVPGDVVGLGRGVLAIAAGTTHSCALMSAGDVKCWGQNDEGELGDGTTMSRSIPADVPGLHGVIGLAAGGTHSCALTTAGGVKCWGYNAGGQLGDGTTKPRLRPVFVHGLTRGVTAIAADRSLGEPWAGHTCALTGAGAVKCWGNNYNGQLGDGTTVRRLQPVPVYGLNRNVIAIASGGYHSCAVIRAGGVKCWGNNGFGQLGDGATGQTVNRLRPVYVSGFGPAHAALAFAAHSAVTSRRVAVIKLRCGAGASCNGALALWTTIRGRVIGSDAAFVKVGLGARRFLIRAARTAVVSVTLPARGYKLLVRLRKLQARVRVSYTQPDGTGTLLSCLVPLILARR